jgi:hypothetical protein
MSGRFDSAPESTWMLHLQTACQSRPLGDNVEILQAISTKISTLAAISPP